MMSLGLAAVSLACLTTGADSTYAEARKTCTETGKPMVVLVGADWCPACKVMKDRVLPQIRQHGVLRRVAFAQVNYDREKELAGQLIAGGPIPQLLVFRREGSAWRLRRLIGGSDVGTVESFISQGIEPEKADSKSGNIDPLRKGERTIADLPGKASAVEATPASHTTTSGVAAAQDDKAE
jgi:thioredoxin-like negative regulator of GroEL